MNLAEVVVYVVRHLVAVPDDVKVTETPGTATTIYELRVAAEDIGRVIGKNGRTVSALRTIVAAIGSRNGQRVILNVIEGDTTTPPF